MKELKKVDVIKNRRVYRIISALIILIGLVMFLVKGLNYGIDFTGGTIIEIKLGEFVEEKDVRKIINDYDKDASIVYAGKNKEELIIKSTKDLSNDDTTAIIAKFKENHKLDGENYQAEKFEALMGKEIKKKALTSMLIAIVAMLAYISWRFEFNFGISAIVALIHDILIMIAFYAVFRIPVNGSFIAAILTILGYSINDTIVIFDRIRENSKLYKKDKTDELVNRSINQSVRRTINTSITTFVAALALYIFGVEEIRILALPLMVGILAGTYSSLFIASPLWYELTERKKA